MHICIYHPFLEADMEMSIDQPHYPKLNIILSMDYDVNFKLGCLIIFFRFEIFLHISSNDIKVIHFEMLLWNIYGIYMM